MVFLGTVEEQGHRKTMIRENKQNGQERSDENETGRLFRPFWLWLLSSLEWWPWLFSLQLRLSPSSCSCASSRPLIVWFSRTRVNVLCEQPPNRRRERIEKAMVKRMDRLPWIQRWYRFGGLSVVGWVFDVFAQPRMDSIETSSWCSSMDSSSLYGELDVY